MIYTNVSFGNRTSNKCGLRRQRYGETTTKKKKTQSEIFLFRPAIPFLAYPTTYYSEITNSSYNWIPASFPSNNLIRIKLAKYSSTGEYLGFFDAFDSHLQLCGHGYTDGRPAFTFGTVFNRTVNELKRWKKHQKKQMRRTDIVTHSVDREPMRRWFVVFPYFEE